MKNIAFLGGVASAMIALAPSAHANDSVSPAAAVMAAQHGTTVFRTGHHGYRMPFRGFVLPAYWIQPRFRVVNWRPYGLYAPTGGYYWSRYYNDAVLRDDRGYVHDYRSGVAWDNHGGYDRPDYGPAMGADHGVYDMDGPGMPTYSDEDGARYEYDGEWTKGRYVDADGRVYEGQWNGTVTRHGEAGAGAPYPAPSATGPSFPPASGYATPGGYDRYERCLRSEGVAGAAIGAVIGAVAGNRIAGRGNRTEGSLIGGGLGALAGLGVEKSMKKCKKYLPDEDRAYGGHAYRGQGYPAYGYYPGYYYYPQPVITTITVGQPVTTTTVTEEVYYETVPVKRKSVRKWKAKPKPKPRCVCR